MSVQGYVNRNHLHFVIYCHKSVWMLPLDITPLKKPDGRQGSPLGGTSATSKVILDPLDRVSLTGNQIAGRRELSYGLTTVHLTPDIS